MQTARLGAAWELSPVSPQAREKVGVPRLTQPCDSHPPRGPTLGLVLSSGRTWPLPIPPDEPFTFEVFSKLGGTRWQLERWVAEGVVVRVFNSVYLPAAAANDLGVRVAALKLVLPEHAVVVDRTAAWLWEVNAFSPSQQDGSMDLEVFVLRGHKRFTRTGAHGGERDLTARDLVDVEGIRVTTPLRTALDLACGLSRAEGLASVDALMRIHGLTREAMQQELPRFRGRRGVVQARALVELADPRAESPGESFTRLAIHDEGLPAPTPQLWVTDLGGRRWRLDLGYESERVAVEYDGEQYHSSRQQRERDRLRRAALAEAGWTVIVVDRTSFKNATLFPWLHRLRRALEGRR